MTELTRTYKLTDSGAWGWVTEEAEGGGGGSLPSWWTVDNTPGSESVDFAGAVGISPAAGATALTLTTEDPGSAFNWMLRLVGPGGEIGGFDSSGGLSLLFQDPDAQWILQGMADMAGPIMGATVTGNGGLAKYTGFDKKGRLFTGNLIPVADGDVAAAAYLHFWFDATNGASKLMMKGKSANGTVVNGEVALT